MEFAKALEIETVNEVRRSIATILADYGNSNYEAKTESGSKFVAHDDAGIKPAVGNKIWYDQDRLTVLSVAPNITFLSIPV